MSWLGLLVAFLRRDWLNETSYRGMIAIDFLGVGSSLILFYSIGRLVGGQPEALQPYGGEYFPFALIGLAVSGYFTIALIAFSNRLRQAQTTGTLEAMFVTRTPAISIILLGGAWDFLLATFRLVIFLSIGILVMRVEFDINLAAAIPTAILSLIAFTALGLVSASLVLVLKRGESIARFGSIVATVFGGVLFPITLLPDWVRPLSYLVPLSYSLEGLRRSTLVGEGLGDVAGSLLGLTVASIILVPLAWLALGWATDYVRRDGSLAQY